MTLELQGIIPALITPFTAGGKAVDSRGLRALVDFLVEQGVHGLVALGGTGEYVALRPKERRQVLEVAVEQSAGRVPVLAGVLAPGMAEAQADMRLAQAVDHPRTE